MGFENIYWFMDWAFHAMMAARNAKELKELKRVIKYAFWDFCEDHEVTTEQYNAFRTWLFKTYDACLKFNMWEVR